MLCCVSIIFHVLGEVDDGNGLEGWRQFLSRNEPVPRVRAPSAWHERTPEVARVRDRSVWPECAWSVCAMLVRFP